MLCRLALSTAAAGWLASAVHAQPAGPPPTPEWRVDVGAAMLVSPSYQGSDEMRVRPLPYLEAAWRDVALLTVREGRARLDVTPLRANGFYAGAETSLLFGQDESSARLPRGFGDIGASFDLGVVAGFETRAFQAEGRVRKALTGHKGVTAELSAALRFPVPGTLGQGRPTIVSVGPSLRYGDATYTRRYFGIDAARSTRTGLARYDAGDLWSVGGSAVVIQPVWRDLTLVGIGSVTRLTGDASRSPIVRQKTNASGIIALAWRFQP
jgi:outer membrane scaffolding protein for murein synthesis (MipA/OmpV family)